MLNVEDYEAIERENIKKLPNRIIEMVNPVVFSSEGYPTRVRDEQELWKYIDVMHETRFCRDFTGIIGGGITEYEFSLIKKLSKHVLQFSEKTFGKKLPVRASLLRALQIYRQINITFEGKPARIFDIGPGSGYLGALLIMNGWAYGATDITQAFYLLQNWLWNTLTENQVIELAETNNWDGSLKANCPIHIPWWEFYQLPNYQIPSVDIVTCNHALAEMHPNSLMYTLFIAHKMLQGDGIKAFVFEGWGYEKLMPRSAVTEQFYRFGFRLVHNDNKITIFCPKENIYANPSANLPSSPPLKLWLLDSLKKKLKLPAGIPSFFPPLISLEENKLSQLIIEGRKRLKKQSLINLIQVKDFYTKLLGSTDHRTEDEKFLELIGKIY